ncbi:ABC transporter permease [Veillonella montpellierensis]|uniref:ABC transporter permease n=1 Tax=Veillonella montpellierensis TaxID=187328 RepID=UPI00040D3A12|nr:ABC transporter permease [Veillonella montpellierensis]
MHLSYKRISKNFLVYLLSLFVLSVVVFWAVSYSPGDPLQAYYGERFDHMTEAQMIAARHQLGLDGSLVTQYVEWMNRLFHGDMGFSLKYRTPVSAVLGGFFINTVILGVISYVLTFTLAILLAVICVYYEDRWIDKLISQVGTLVFYLPTFWVALLLILVFNVNLGWLPGSGAYEPGNANDWVDRLRHIVLPVIVMLIAHVWYYAYMIRNKLLDETRKDYVLLAKMKGLSSFAILVKHCLRNIAPTIFSVMAIGTNHIIGGSYVVEAVFAYPGLGNLAVESAKLHDYNLLMIIVLITGAVVIGSSYIAQGISEQVDYRMKDREEVGQ